MALTSDVLIERSQLKRQVTFWRLAAVGVMVFFLIMLVERNASLTDVTPGGGHYIARLTIKDVVTEDRRLYDLLDDIREDDDISAVLLYLDTPGGVAAAGETIYQKVAAIREVKPVVVSMRSVCASAGYMISLAADHVVAMRSTITGSIGVLLQAAELSELAKKVGVTPITITSGPYKGSPSMSEPLTEPQRAVLQDMIDEFHTAFIDMVADERKLPTEEVRRLADGRVYSAMRAKELGLIDELGGEPEALAWLQKEKDLDAELKVRDLEIKSRVDRVIDKLGQSMGLGWLERAEFAPSDGLLLLWRPAL